MTYVVAVDSGGTFTDCVAISAAGTVTRAKAPSTPPQFEEGVLASIAEVANKLGVSREQLLQDTTIFAHGTTVATNVLITRTGAKTALLTTRGHEDAILIGRTAQKVAGLSESEIIDVSRLRKAEPVVPRELIFGIDERVSREGSVVAPLRVENLGGLRDVLEEQGVEAIAISLLWSFLNPDHERALHNWAATIGSNGGPRIFVTSSSTLVPVIREYERTSTTALNAYLSPRVDGYLVRMQDRLRASGHDGAIAVMHSAGGVSSIDEARHQGVALLSSGPAGGMLGARAMADRLGLDRVLATDVGGTSFDVGIIVDGQPSYAESPVFAQYPVALPVIDVTSIGAGGGSIAWIEEETGVLKVGPQSAGARPGPACYGLGGELATVTDANLVLGRLNPDYFLGGRMRLDVDRARTAVQQLAEPLGVELEEAAAAVVDIVDSQMADLIRRATVERGLDPAPFAVFSYGGAGGMHAGAYAKRLGCREIVVPKAAAVFSAFGIGHSDAKRIAVASEPMREPFDLGRWARRLGELETSLVEKLEAERLPTDDLVLRHFVDLQLRGQVHAVRVPIDEEDLGRADGGEHLIQRFVDLYEARYGPGTAYRQAGVEVSTFVVEAIASLRIPVPAPLPSEGRSAESARKGTRDVYISEAGSFRTIPLYTAELLRTGNELDGPALVEAEDTTIYVHAGQRLWVDGYENLRVQLDAS